MLEDTREIPGIDHIDLSEFIPTPNKKYYLITWGGFYEAKFKFFITVYNSPVAVFKTKLGDRHFQLKSRWANVIIFENKLSAMAYIGIQTFKGRIIARAPWELDRHFRFALKYFPHKMI